jgi:hypothetical protein
MERIGDLKPFTGWVEVIAEDHVRIRLGGSQEGLVPGDQLHVEVAGKRHMASFVAEVKLVAGCTIELTLNEPVELLPRKEAPRVNMFGERCRIILDDAEIIAMTVDISEYGLGLLLTIDLEPKTKVSFEVCTQLGSVRGLGKVLYSRADPFNPSRFRAGLEVSGFSRVDQERWNLLQDYEPSPW